MNDPFSGRCGSLAQKCSPRDEAPKTRTRNKYKPYLVFVVKPSRMAQTKGVYVRSVSIRGFKSFGSQAQSFTFSEGINLIAGANGSGKSNILEAICFALCEKTSSLRIQRLCELQSSNTGEACEVVLEFESRAKHGKRCRSELSVQLLPDGVSRQYKLDGKIKTIKEIKEFLHERRLFMEDTSAVMHQSKVTELADTNSPDALASIISAASGAGRWNEEVERAQQELKKTRKGLQDVFENISTLEKAIAKDETRMAKMSKSRQLEFEISAASKQLYNFQVQKSIFLQRSIEEKTSEIAARRALAETQNQMLKKQEAELMLLKRKPSKTSERIMIEREKLLDAKAAKEEEKLVCETRLRTAFEDAATLESCARLAQTLESSICMLNSQLQQKQELIHKLEQDSLQTTATSYAQDLREMISRADEKLKELQFQQVHIADSLASSISDKSFKETRLADMEKELAELLQSYSAKPETYIVSNQLQALKTECFVVRKRLDDLGARQQYLSEELGTLSADEAALPAWAMHSVFHFKEPNCKAEEFLLPLSIIAGSLRKICVVETTSAAASLLQIWSRTAIATVFSRIWPLDRLYAAERTSYQQSVRDRYPNGAIVLPIDLFYFDKKFEKAMQRAFGGYVIASTDEIARDLIEKHGIWSVTLDGKINRRGSVSGGWRGAYPTSYLSLKLEGDGIDAERYAVMIKMNQAEKDFQETGKSLTDLQSFQTQRSAWLQEIQSLKAEVAILLKEISQQENLLAENKKMLDLFTEELERAKGRLELLPDSKEHSDPGHFERALNAEKFDEAAVLDALEKQTSQQQHNLMLQRKLKQRLQDSAVDSLKQEVERFGKEIGEIDKALYKVDMKIDQTRLETEKKAAQITLEVAEVESSKKRVAELFEEIEGMEKTALLLRDAKKQAKEEAEKLSRIEFQHCDGQMLEVKDLEDEQEFSNCKQHFRKLRLEFEKAKTNEEMVTVEEQMLFKERTEKLHLFRQHWSSISESMAILLDGINKSKAVVQDANEATFQMIRSSFIDCCKVILPNMCFDLVKMGKLVEDGVRFSFCNSVDYESSKEWKSNLQQLSGGQRTLLSIAFILMVARCGETSLYLMDEVDAALDEQNQARVARLIQSTIGKTSQVIAVSHNISFQKCCDTVIKVHMVDGSTRLQ